MSISLTIHTSLIWINTNPTLALGAIGQESDTDKFKLGDGVTAWNSLAYHSPDSNLEQLVGLSGAVNAAALTGGSSGTSVPLSTVTTKGDLISGTGAGTVARFPAGSDGQVLGYDSTQSTGLKALTAVTLAQAGQMPSQAPVAASGTGSVGVLAFAKRADAADPWSHHVDVRKANISNFPRWVNFVAGNVIPKGITYCYFTAALGGSFTQIQAWTGTSAASAITHAGMAIYSVDASGNLTLLSATTDDATTFASTGTRYTKSLGATVTIAQGGRYAFGVGMAGTTAPSLYGVVYPNQSVILKDIMSNVAGDRLFGADANSFTGTFPATRSDASANITEFSSSAAIPYVELVP